MNIRKLKEEQLKLAKKVVVKDDFDKIELIGGCDQAFFDNKIVSAVTVLDYKTLKVVEKIYAVVDSKVPYIPGFLAYREAPAVVEAFTKLEKKPDILMVDSNGILHPRRIGMASHLGVILDIPTIGVAKNLMMGDKKENKIYVEEEARAMEVVTKEHANPLYVSPGHRISLKTSVEIVKNCIKLPHKLPEPIHHAHRFSKEIMKKEGKKGE